MWFSVANGAEGSPEGSDQGDNPTNLGLLKTTLEEAIEQVCDRLSSHEYTTICLQSRPDEDGRWLVEQVLAGQLLARGYRTILTDSLSRRYPEICSDAGILRYRIVQLDLDYASTRRQHLFGPRLVERKVQLSLFFQLSRPSGELVWTDAVKKTGGDWIPQKDLPLVEQESISFLSPRLKSDGWGRLAEPILLTAAIGGLIYLFYATQ
jgi:hypothetical protein